MLENINMKLLFSLSILTKDSWLTSQAFASFLASLVTVIGVGATIYYTNKRNNTLKYETLHEGTDWRKDLKTVASKITVTKSDLYLVRASVYCRPKEDPYIVSNKSARSCYYAHDIDYLTVCFYDYMVEKYKLTTNSNPAFEQSDQECLRILCIGILQVNWVYNHNYSKEERDRRVKRAYVETAERIGMCIDGKTLLYSQGKVDLDILRKEVTTG